MHTNDTNVELVEKPHKLVAPVYLNNGISSVVVIPKKIARKYKIDKPSHVTIEDTGNGILLSRLDL